MESEKRQLTFFEYQDTVETTEFAIEQVIDYILIFIDFLEGEGGLCLERESLETQTKRALPFYRRCATYYSLIKATYDDLCKHANILRELVNDTVIVEKRGA